VPPELDARRERNTLAALLASIDDDRARRRALAKLALLEVTLEAGRRGLRRDRAYEGRLIERFGGR
jgi:hypothetical protein